MINRNYYHFAENPVCLIDLLGEYSILELTFMYLGGSTTLELISQWVPSFASFLRSVKETLFSVENLYNNIITPMLDLIIFLVSCKIQVLEYVCDAQSQAYFLLELHSLMFQVLFDSASGHIDLVQDFQDLWPRTSFWRQFQWKKTWEHY